MGYLYKTPQSIEEWRSYYQLRWEVLREPWHQPAGSERDKLEEQAFHIMAVDTNQNSVVGVGRLHRLDYHRVQIRYMAVHPNHQGIGIGVQLLSRLEQQAVVLGVQEILLNARTTSLEFYLHRGYRIIEAGPLLFGTIAHMKMSKQLV